jgi:hypothetical protein
MTTDDERQHAVTDAASGAYWHMKADVIKMAEAGGAEIRERPMFPGSFSIERYAEPLAGIRAAVTLVSTAERIKHENTQRAREAGIIWQQIGEALGLADGDDAKSGYDLGVAAFEHMTGEPDIWHQPNFYFRCPSCGAYITDRGPYESHPEDNEHRHAEGCSRMAAMVAAWQAERDSWERGG